MAQIIVGLLTDVSYNPATGELTATGAEFTFEDGALIAQGDDADSIATIAEICPGTENSTGPLKRSASSGHLLWNGAHLINQCSVGAARRTGRLSALLRAFR